VVRAEELTETESNIARSIRPLVFTGGNAVDEAADIHRMPANMLTAKL
jgi:hypothetical protein